MNLGTALSGMRFTSPIKSSLSIDSCTPTSATTAFNDNLQLDSSSTTNLHAIHHDHWQDFLLPIQLQILSNLTPLASFLTVSRSFQHAIHTIVSIQSRKFKEQKDEASTWGHKATHLYEVLHLEPLVVQGIIQVTFDPIYNGHTPNNRKDIEKTLPQLQRHIFKGIEFALDSYETCWGSIVPLLAIARKYKLQYISYNKASTANLLDAVTQSEPPSTGLDSIDSIDTTNDLAGFSDTLDQNWIKWNERLCILASNYGHVANFPAYHTLSRDNVNALQRKAMSGFVKCGSVNGVFMVVESARVWGGFWEIVAKGLRVCLKLARRIVIDDSNGDGGNCAQRTGDCINVAVLLLGYVLNDCEGPYARRRDTQVDREVGRDIIGNAMKLNETMNLSFNYNAKIGQFAVMHPEDALRVTFDKLYALQ